MVESGLCDSFEMRLDRWQGMAESGSTDLALQVLIEMARVRACVRSCAPVRRTNPFALVSVVSARRRPS
jgi:hypothetical protein